jgi:multicomponent Na+:H+ antiporter subunit A
VASIKPRSPKRGDVPSPAAVALIAVGLPFAAALCAPAGFRQFGHRVAWAAAAVAGICFLLVGWLATRAPVDAAGLAWVPGLGSRLAIRVDGLALLLAALASGVGVLVFVYSRAYAADDPRGARYYATLLAFLGAMLGVAFAADLLVLFVCWELTSVASFLLIGHHSDDPEAVASARKALFVTVAGGLFLLVGLLALHRASAAALGAASWNLTEMIAAAPAMRTALGDAGLLLPALLLIGIGIAAKSAQVPLHVWLPGAMAAPTPVSAFLHAATMVKAGVYLAGRLRPLFLPGAAGGHGGAGAGAAAVGAAADAAAGALAAGVLTPWTLLFASLGLLTMTVTAILAVGAADIKRLLAYSTASHLGLIVAAFGLPVADGAGAGALHVLVHALFKGALFLVAGIVAHETGTRALAELGGLRRDLPVTAAVAVVGGLAMAGLPPFSGFFSKELLLKATVETARAAGGAAWLLPALATIGSVFTVLYSLRFVRIFVGEPGAERAAHRPPVAMLAPAALLGLLVAAMSADLVAGGAATGALLDPAAAAAGGTTIHATLPTHLSLPVLLSGVAIGGGLLSYPAIDRTVAAVRGAGAVGTRAALTPDAWYESGVAGLEASGDTAVAMLQTGTLRTYAVWSLSGTVGLALAGYLATWSGIGGAAAAPGPAVGIVLLVAVGAAGAVVRAPSHAAGVLTLSILGFMLAILYVLNRAPDLALTQLVVETLLLAAFLLVVDRLPAFYGSLDRGRAARDLVLSLAVGATVALTVLVTTRGTPDAGVAPRLLERAGVPAEHGAFFADFGGGANVVNVILVDFRALDTMGEISVVGLAAIGVLSLLGRRSA